MRIYIGSSSHLVHKLPKECNNIPGGEFTPLQVNSSKTDQGHWRKSGALDQNQSRQFRFFILSYALRGCDVIFVHRMMKESEMMEELSAMHSM